MSPELNDQLAGLFSDLSDLDKAVQTNPPEPEEKINEHQVLIDRLPIGICRVSLAPDGKFLLVNPAFRRMFALETADDEAAFTLSDLFAHEADLKAFINDLIADNRSTTLQVRLRKRTGVTLLCTLNAVSDAEVLHADCAIEDVTERQQAQEQNELWNLRYELVTAHWQQVVYDCDTQNGLMLWGGGVQDVLGYTSAQMHGGLSQWAERVHPDDRGRLLSAIDVAETNLSSYEVEYRFRKSNGEYVWVLDRGFYIPDDAGRPARRVGMLQDVTAKHAAESSDRDQGSGIRDLGAANQG